MNGHHVVRWSDAYWAGVSTDLAIEQELMSSIKKTGGLTRGCGMTELQCVKWLLSTPACAEIKSAVHSLTGISFETIEQHKALQSSRMERDYTDAMKILKFLIERLGLLKSLSTGNYGLYIDNYFVSIPLLKHLSIDGIGCTGTLRKNMLQDCPVSDNKFLKKQQKGYYEGFKDNNSNVIVCRWNDNGPV